MLPVILHDVTTYGPSVVSVLLTVIGACAVAAAHLPKPSEGAAGWWATARVVLDYVAQNYGNAKNVK